MVALPLLLPLPSHQINSHTPLITPVIHSIDIGSIVIPAPKPNYDLEVLKPLKQKQTAISSECAKAGGTLDGLTCKLPPPLPPPPPPPPPPAPVALPLTDGAMGFIFARESGNNPAAVNRSSGACGLGQALPCGKLAAVCPNWPSDYGCQVSFFTTYAVSRYGSWSGAEAFWLAHSWW